jgi:hypothetical protein
LSSIIGRQNLIAVWDMFDSAIINTKQALGVSFYGFYYGLSESRWHECSAMVVRDRFTKYVRKSLADWFNKGW